MSTYTKTTWIDGSAPAINANNLNKIENQLEQNTNDISSLVQNGSTGTNSSYTKLSDGTLICYGRTDQKDCAANTATTFDVSFAHSFVNNNYSVALSRRNGGNNYISAEERTTNTATSGFTVYAWNGSSTVASALQYDYVAIGRWK